METLPGHRCYLGRRVGAGAPIANRALVCCRFPPNPCFLPINFYSAVRLGDPEQLAKIMETDPYFITQDNGAGAPIHFATTYKQLDMVRGRAGTMQGARQSLRRARTSAAHLSQAPASAGHLPCIICIKPPVCLPLAPLSRRSTTC